MACEHLRQYRVEHGVRGYVAVSRCLQWKQKQTRKQEQAATCSMCGRAGGRLYVCIVCASVGCWTPPNSLHARSHARCSPGHDIAVDLYRAELFCCSCNDQVYDKDFDAAVLSTLSVARSPSATKSAPIRRPRMVKYRLWIPSAREKVVIIRRSSPIQSNVPCGLRGLNNLGNTCFINSVLQALIHTPPLRNYFLSDRHNRFLCERNRMQTRCLACDMDAIYSAAFCGDRKPFSPTQFLYSEQQKGVDIQIQLYQASSKSHETIEYQSWWQHAADFASYEQQDAHEFFISMLDGIHANDGKQNGNSKDNGDHCCIAHRVFSGILRSDVTCSVCGFTSTAYDPCVDISLDLEPQFGVKKQLPEFSYDCNIENDKSGLLMDSQGISTLLGCLDRFTRPERLGSEQKLYCQHCDIRQECIKQMSVRRLPLVLCFHIKRFEHSSTKNTSRKVDRYLQFPFSLDMSPYMSSFVVRSRHGNRITSLNDEESDPSPSVEMCSEFELFAVVAHTGNIDAGHYVSYLRLADQWYKCDDAWVSCVSEHTVRSSQCYMMYYVQKTFRYKADE